VYKEFELDLPRRLDEALELLAGGNRTALLAGGTNLIVDMRAKREQPGRIVGLGNIAELEGIQNDGTRISIGGRTTVSDLLRSTDIGSSAPSLVEAAGVFAGQMVRNTATVAGNIACGSPAADLVPPLMSLDADITLTSKSGERTLALDKYFSGYKTDERRADELISRIAWPILPEPSVNSFYKLARRKGDAITVTGVAVTLAVKDGRCHLARIALGAVAPVVFRAKQAEAMLEGEVLTADVIDAAARQAMAECSPIDDVRASAKYRLHTVHMLVRRLVGQACDQLA